MRKNIFKTALCSVLALAMTTSCELDQYPDGVIPANKAWEKMDDAVNFYTGLLSSLRGSAGGSQVIVSEVQSDLFNLRREAIALIGEHDWTFSTGSFAGDGCWSSNYGLITTANNIIENIDRVPVKFIEDSVNYYQIKGSSLFARALAYSNMLPRYSKNYDEATAKQDLGLPLLEHVDINAKPSRSSLYDSYEFVQNDINTAIKFFERADFLKNDILASSKEPRPMLESSLDQPGIASATALKARVCLEMKKYDEAIAAATSLFGDFPLTSADEYASLWEYDEGSEIIYQPLMSAEKGERGGLGGYFFGYYEQKQIYQPDFIPTQGLIDLYEDEDVRKSAFFTVKPIGVADITDEANLFNKYPGNPSLRKPEEDGKNHVYNMFKVFRTSEMYLIAAEASLMKTNRDENAAKQYLNELRAQRNASPLTSSGKILDNEMKKEWILEMVGEGVRLNCLKRWNDGVKRLAPQTFKELILQDNPKDKYTKLNVQPEDDLYYKMVWEVPQNDLMSNKNLVPNWK